VSPGLTMHAWTQLDSLDPGAAESPSDVAMREINGALAALAMRHHELLASLRSINARLKADVPVFATTPPDGQPSPAPYHGASRPPFATEGPADDKPPPTVPCRSEKLRSTQQTLPFPPRRNYNYFDRLDTLLAALGQ